MAKKAIKDMANELYQDDTLAAAVCADAERLGTVKRIEKGELHLPHPIDAKRWLERKTAELRKQDEEDE